MIVGSTDASGSYNSPGTWPSGMAPGLTFYFQSWILDPGGPAGFSATNALTGTTPLP